jgi:hypothetical protein
MNSILRMLFGLKKKKKKEEEEEETNKEPIKL